MSIVVNIGIFFLSIIYGLLKKLPIQKKIVYISRQMDKPSVDFLLIKNDMEKRYPDYKSVILSKTLGNGIAKKIGYAMHMFRQMYHLATSQAVVLDTYCITASVLKHRKSLVIIQMWHALGALKKFGYSILDKPEGSTAKTAKILKMHNNYSYVFASSDYCRKFFAEAFNQPINAVKVFPLPRVDLLLNKEYKEKVSNRIYAVYPQLNEEKKKTIVYAPTFRKTTKSYVNEIQMLIDTVDYKKYNLVVKLHPIEQTNYSNSKAIFDNCFSTFEMFYIADAIISDYSAVIFEGMLLHKPIYLYAFDYNSYNKNRDFYTDYLNLFDGIIYKDRKDLLESIENNNYKEDTTQKVLQMMIQRKESSYTEEIVDFIINLCKRK